MIFGITESVLNLVFNGVLVLAILGLWGLWFHQAGQRKKVETLLHQAASDLQQATTLLDQVMKQMQAQNQGETKRVATPKSENNALSTGEQAMIARNIHKLQTPLPSKKKATPVKQEVNISAKVMRLKREGLDMPAIAKALRLPIAQVRLMLLLQTAKA